MTGAINLIADVMHVLPVEGLHQHDIVAEVERIAKSDDTDPSRRLPEGMTSSYLFRHLVHQGALQLRDREAGGEPLYACPIPNFRHYLIARGNARHHQVPNCSLHAVR